jgi:hypothetical protein
MFYTLCIARLNYAQCPGAAKTPPLSAVSLNYVKENFTRRIQSDDYADVDHPYLMCTHYKRNNAISENQILFCGLFYSGISKNI